MDNQTPNHEDSRFSDYGDKYTRQQPVSPKKNSPLALASFIVGLIGLISCCCSVLGLILGVISLILVILSKQGRPFEPFAIAGLVLSILAILASLAFFAYSILVINMMQDPAFNSLMNQVMEQYESLPAAK
ncbi:MAG: DUF4190 domain-containing protein [bacterium]|nr:DUF4190 domain-containing protein [bacterium]